MGLELREASAVGGFHWNPQKLEPLTEITLTACSVGVFRDDIDKWPKRGELWLNGFTHDGPGKSATRRDAVLWIERLRRMPGFHSQPYEQIAKVYRVAGRTVEAQKVSIVREWARTKTLGTEEVG